MGLYKEATKIGKFKHTGKKHGLIAETIGEGFGLIKSIRHNLRGNK